MEKHKLIKDIRGECECENIKYCPLEAIIHTNQRVFEQHKLVEIIKFKYSTFQHREIGWDEAYNSWVGEGFAEKFANIYDEKLNHKELAKLVGLER